MSKQGIFNIIISVIIGIILSICIIKLRTINKERQSIEIRLEQPEFLMSDLNDTIMLQACRYYGIRYPEIVTAQGILESGNFRSKVFREYNNPFGLYNSKIQDYYRFKHWTDAIIAYKTMVEYKYKEGDYYKFLLKLPYAEDSLYISKLKNIVKRYESDINDR